MKVNPSLKADGVTLITGEVRLSYCHLLEPVVINGQGAPKYSVSVIIPKSDKETLNMFKEIGFQYNGFQNKNYYLFDGIFWRMRK